MCYMNGSREKSGLWVLRNDVATSKEFLRHYSSQVFQSLILQCESVLLIAIHRTSAPQSYLEGALGALRTLTAFIP